MEFKSENIIAGTIFVFGIFLQDFTENLALDYLFLVLLSSVSTYIFFFSPSITSFYVNYMSQPNFKKKINCKFTFFKNIREDMDDKPFTMEEIEAEIQRIKGKKPEKGSESEYCNEKNIENCLKHLDQVTIDVFWFFLKLIFSFFVGIGLF